MNIVRKPFKVGELIFDFGEKSDDLYLIHAGSLEIVSREGLVLATLKTGELFGEMASILGECERTARTVTATYVVIDVIYSTTMWRKHGGRPGVARARSQPDHPACRRQQDERDALAASQRLSELGPRRDRAPLTSSASDKGWPGILQNHLNLASLSFLGRWMEHLLRKQANALALAQIHFIYAHVKQPEIEGVVLCQSPMRLQPLCRRRPFM